jgi:hypothetical protein
MASDLPELFVDFNGRVTERGYMLTYGTYQDLERLGITLEQAVGLRFVFNGGADSDEHGFPADIKNTGTIVHDPEFKFLANVDGDFYWQRTDT